MVHAAGHLDGEEAAQRGDHPTHGEDHEGGDDGPALGLRPEALSFDDQQREDTGAHDERDDVGGVQ